MKTIKKDECSYSVSNAIRTLAMVREAGLEPAPKTAITIDKSSVFVIRCAIRVQNCIKPGIHRVVHLLTGADNDMLVYTL